MGASTVNSLIASGGRGAISNGVDLAGTLSACDSTNSLPLAKVSDYTTCLPSVETYDDVKVQAIINEIDGLKSDGGARTQVPTIFGMNFKDVSVGQKLPVGGHSDAADTPSTNLEAAIAHADASLGKIVAELKRKSLLASTLIIISAKHGQSLIDKAALAMEGRGSGNVTVRDPSNSISAVDATVDSPSTFTNPSSSTTLSTNGHLRTDDVGLVWLQNQSAGNISSVVAQLKVDAAQIFANTLPVGTIFSSSDGIVSSAALSAIFGDPTNSSDPVASARAPDVFIQPSAGVIYSGSSKKIAEHGVGSSDDTSVALLVSMPSLKEATISTPVATTQIAPTILKALGLDPTELQAVQPEREHGCAT